MPVNLPDGIRRKEIPARDVPSLPETERDHRLGVRFVERIDDALEADAVPEVLHLSDPWQELHLPHQDELEELIFVGLIVEEGPQELQQGRTQPLGFVDQQHDRPIVLHALLEEVSLEDLEGSDDGQRTRRRSNPEELHECREKLGLFSSRFRSWKSLRLSVVLPIPTSPKTRLSPRFNLMAICSRFRTALCEADS